ncbi:hypothetical protein BCR33DRAFT_724532, partial [Rhizoclosmatium globosum]
PLKHNNCLASTTESSLKSLFFDASKACPLDPSFSFSFFSFSDSQRQPLSPYHTLQTHPFLVFSLLILLFSLCASSLVSLRVKSLRKESKALHNSHKHLRFQHRRLVASHQRLTLASIQSQSSLVDAHTECISSVELVSMLNNESTYLDLMYRHFRTLFDSEVCLHRNTRNQYEAVLAQLKWDLSLVTAELETVTRDSALVVPDVSRFDLDGQLSVLGPYLEKLRERKSKNEEGNTFEDESETQSVSFKKQPPIPQSPPIQAPLEKFRNERNILQSTRVQHKNGQRFAWKPTATNVPAYPSTLFHVSTANPKPINPTNRVVQNHQNTFISLPRRAMSTSPTKSHTMQRSTVSSILVSAPPIPIVIKKTSKVHAALDHVKSSIIHASLAITFDQVSSLQLYPPSNQ